MIIAPKTVSEWVADLRARRCAPPPWTYTESFALYMNTPKKLQQHLYLTTLLKVPDLVARAENSGSEACYVEVARWSYLRERWEKFAFAKCFGGEIKEFPDLSDVDTCHKIASLINERQGRQPAPLISSLPSFNTAVRDTTL